MNKSLIGPGDNFYPEKSHVISAMLRRFHEAVQTGANQGIVWRRGTQMCEFLHVDDVAGASEHVMEFPPGDHIAHSQLTLSHINAGKSLDCTIRDLAETISRVTGFAGHLVGDSIKPDGTPRKLIDVAHLASLG